MKASPLFRVIALVSAVVFVSAFASCRRGASAPGERGSVQGTAREPARVALVVPTNQGGPASFAETAARARALVTEGGPWKLVEAPWGRSGDAREAFIAAVAAQADDPALSAVVVAPAPVGTAEAFRRAAEARPALIRIAVTPDEAPESVQASATLVVEADFVAASFDAASVLPKTARAVWVDATKGVAGETARRKAAFRETLAARGLSLAVLDAQAAVADRKPGALDAFASRALDGFASGGGGTVGVLAADETTWLAFARAAKGRSVILLGCPDPSFESLYSVLGADRAALAEAWKPAAFLGGVSTGTAVLLEPVLALAGRLDGSAPPRDFATAWAEWSGPPGKPRLAAIHYVDPSIDVRSKNHLLVRVPLSGIGVEPGSSAPVPGELYRFSE